MLQEIRIRKKFTKIQVKRLNFIIQNKYAQNYNYFIREYGLKNFKHLNESAYVVDSFATILSTEEAIAAINQSNVSKTSTAHIGNQICSVLSTPVPNNTYKKCSWAIAR